MARGSPSHRTAAGLVAGGGLTPPSQDYAAIFAKAKSRALGGGVAGAAAMVINVSTLMCVAGRRSPPPPEEPPLLPPPRAGLKAGASLPRRPAVRGAPRAGPPAREPAGSGFRN